jgi:ubiquinone/menaquinone biosynthesis C-methylase UbiE
MNKQIKESALNAYDDIAPFYDRLARLVFGKSIVESQITHIDEIPANSKVLILGGGTGWLLEEMLKRGSHCQYWYLEASEEMIRRTRKRVGEIPHVTYIHGRLNSIPEGIAFDVVVANFFFDQFISKDVTKILLGLKSTLTKGGLVLIAEFQDKKWWHKGLLFIMYRFFTSIRAVVIRSLPEWKVSFHETGFEIVQEKDFFGHFILSAVYKNS